MMFGEIPVDDARGAILAHSVRAGTRVFKKGRVLGAIDLAALVEAGVERVTAVQLEPGDVTEDDAASRIAHAFTGDNIRQGAAFTGRANLYAEADGIATCNRASIDSVNRIDESITIATLDPFTRVTKGQIVATVKIVPYAAPEPAVAAVEKIAAPIRVYAFQPMTFALISTMVPGMKLQLLEKNHSAVRTRIEALGGRLVADARTPHEPDAIAAAVGELRKDWDALLIFGASAIVDRNDVVPAGIVAAGGTVEHFGMPVDPGNLLLIGRLNGKPVIGLPGCARSPKLNGFDFVLQRLFARLPVTRESLSRMGVGGLLADIPSRPQPRELAPDMTNVGVGRAPKIAALVLAAGTSSRMGENKLTADWRGQPIVRHTVEAALKSHADSVMAVTGHQADGVRAALAGLRVGFAENANYAEGLSTSLRAGLKALSDCDGAIVLLGDMPEVTPALIDRMIAAFSPEDGRAIVLATRHGKRGNPVLWARRFFADMEQVAGDTGAKHLIGDNEELVCEVEAGDDAVLNDVDTPEELAALRTRAGQSMR